MDELTKCSDSIKSIKECNLDKVLKNIIKQKNLMEEFRIAARKVLNKWKTKNDKSSMN